MLSWTVKWGVEQRERQGPTMSPRRLQGVVYGASEFNLVLRPQAEAGLHSIAPGEM